jgi:hypothetical protein
MFGFVKPVLQVALTLACFVAVPTLVSADPLLAVPHLADFHYQASDADRPMGVLGLRLGTFAVIEGIEHQTSMTWGGADFVVEAVNGQKPAHEIRIQTDWFSGLVDKKIPGRHYVLHGWEAGTWAGQPTGLPANEPGHVQLAGFFFQHTFVVSSVEKVNGVTVADAKPLDPTVPLETPVASPVPTESAPPIGQLGLPLGTFAVIEVQKPAHPLLMANPYAVVRVNGVDVDPPRVISIPDLKSTTDERTVLRGYETGAWANDPSLPKSENPSGMQAQAPFQFFREFIMTSRAK